MCILPKVSVTCPKQKDLPMVRSTPVSSERQTQTIVFMACFQYLARITANTNRNQVLIWAVFFIRRRTTDVDGGPIRHFLARVTGIATYK